MEDRKELVFEKCKKCGSIAFMGKLMQCSNGHDIDISNMNRDEVVVYYKLLINSNLNEPNSLTVIDFNKKIINKWSLNALNYIKSKSWKKN